MKLKRKLKTGPVWNPLLSLNTLCVLYHLTLIFSILFIVADTNIFSLSLSLHLSGLLHYRQILHRLNHNVESIRIMSSKISGEGNGTPLQQSCLENLMGGGAWWAAIRGVAKSRTRLSDFTFTFHFHALEKEMATHSSVLALRIPGTGEPGGLLSMGSHRVGHN